MSGVFDKVVAAVPIREAAERYGMHVNRAGMTRCPFHDDHTPSMKLNEDYYYCFGCGAKGDVVDLTAALFNLKPYDAAQKLAADFGPAIRTDTQTGAGACSSSQDRVRCRKILNDYLDLLTRWKNRYRPTVETEAPDARYVEACLMLDYIEYLTAMLACGTPEQRRLITEEIASDGKTDRKGERLSREENSD